MFHAAISVNSNIMQSTGESRIRSLVSDVWLQGTTHINRALLLLNIYMKIYSGKYSTKFKSHVIIFTYLESYKYTSFHMLLCV